MGREIHKAKIMGRTRYAMLSTVTMEYATPFMPRKPLVEQMRKEGYRLPVISRMFKEATVVKKVSGKQEMSFHVVTLGVPPSQTWRQQVNEMHRKRMGK